MVQSYKKILTYASKSQEKFSFFSPFYKQISMSKIFYPHSCRAQLLFIVCIFIHLAFISTTISRPGEGNRLLPLKREGRRGAYADRDDDVSVGCLVLFLLVLFSLIMM